MNGAPTLAEEIIGRAARVRVRPGDEVWAEADRMIMNDSSGPRRLAGLVEELGGLWDRSRVVVVSDHFVPAANLRHAAILKTTRQWARAEQIGAFHEYEGILHAVVLERGLVGPGMLVVGADSHTTTAGAAGALGLAVGSTELATVLATGQVWLTVPPTIRVDLVGHLAPGCDVRDVTMHLLGEHGDSFALGHALEFGGDFVATAELEVRQVLANQGIEMGAVAALVDLGGARRADWARYLRVDVSRLEPACAAGSSPSAVRPARELTGLPIDMAWIGSCVGGRAADLRAAADVLGGRQVSVPTLVTPATRGIHRQAVADGTIETLLEAGCTILPPACGACAGVHAGVQGAGDRVIATATRNFPGRMGSREADVLLASAFTVAASAVRGAVIDPRALEVIS